MSCVATTVRLLAQYLKRVQTVTLEWCLTKVKGVFGPDPRDSDRLTILNRTLI